MYVRGYLQGSENGRVVTIDLSMSFIIFNMILLFSIDLWLLISFDCTYTVTMMFQPICILQLDKEFRKRLQEITMI